MTDFATEVSNLLDELEGNSENASLPLSKRSVPSDAISNISSIIEPLRNELRNVSFGQLIEALENLISNSTNNTSPEVQNILRQIRNIPILGNIIDNVSAATDVSHICIILLNFPSILLILR